MADQTLEVKITGDTTGLTKATSDAARQLEGLQKDVQTLDKESVDITPEIQVARINRDLANLNKALDGLERRKAHPDVGLDTVQLLRDEAKVRRAIDDLEKQKVDIEATIDVDDASVSNLRGMSTALREIGGETTNLIPVPGSLRSLTSAAGGASRALKGLGAEGTAAAGAMGAAGAAGAAGALVIGLGAVAYSSGMAAADIETLQVQLDALTGGRGTETLKFLQAWAKQTPFELDQATEATRMLVAAGVDLEDLPSTLNELGNVAAATTGDITGLASVFAQMRTKGQIYAEEMMQLSERGIPAWTTLADAMGKTVPEVQKMATEGKLGADAIDLLQKSLAQKYPTAIPDLMDTLNGKLSSLRDTTKQTWQEFGTNFLPALKDGADLMQEVADVTSDTVRIFNALVDAVPGKDLLTAPLESTSNWISKTGHSIDLLADKLTGTDDEATQLGKDGKDSMDDLTGATQEATVTVEDLTSALGDAADAYAAIGEGKRLRISFLIDSAGLEQQVEDAVKEGTSLPADLTIGDIKGLSDKQTELLSTISSFAEQGLEEGARRAQLDVNFDQRAWYEQVRQKTRGLLIKAGIDTKDANRILKNFIGLPRPGPKLRATMTGVEDAQAALGGLTKPRKIPLSPYITGRAAGVQEALDALIYGPSAKNVPAQIEPKVTDTSPANQTLNNVAQPGGQAREATMKPIVDFGSWSAVNNSLNDLAKDRYATIYVTTVNRGGGGGGGGGGGTSSDFGRSAVPGTEGLMAAGRALAAPSATSTGGGAWTTSYRAGIGGPQVTTQPGGVVQLAPRQTPVKVYLDGAEIADHLELRAGRLATSTSLKRRP